MGVFGIMFVLVITAVSNGLRNRRCFDNTARELACNLLNLAESGTIDLWERHASTVQDNAYAYNNIEDACNGRAASRSSYTCRECRRPGAPGGRVCLRRVVLQYIYAVHQKLGDIHVRTTDPQTEETDWSVFFD